MQLHSSLARELLVMCGRPNNSSRLQAAKAAAMRAPILKMLEGVSTECATHASSQALLDTQLASVKEYNTASFTLATDVHPITMRYAELTTSLLLLNADYQACTCPLLFTSYAKCTVQGWQS